MLCLIKVINCKFIYEMCNISNIREFLLLEVLVKEEFYSLGKTLNCKFKKIYEIN